MSTEFQTITPQRLAELCQSDGNIELIDVRTPVEFRELHCSYARNVPLESLNPKDVMTARQWRR